MRHWSIFKLCIILLLLAFSSSAFSQFAKVRGRVVQSKTNAPIDGVAVYLEGTSFGAITDSEGSYELGKLPPGHYSLVARIIGYDVKRIALELNSNDELIQDFQLKENFTEISGIVIRGSTITGGSRGIHNIPGSAQYISPKELEKFNNNDINRALRSVPGINIQEEEGFGLRPNIGMRGTGVERSSKITLMEDGILMAPAPYAAPAAYYFPTVGRMQGIEVRKGSSQIKYGPYTTGGAINFISTQIPDEFSGKIKMTGGSFGQRILHANLGQSFEHAAFLVETYQAGSDGFKNLDNGGNTGFNTRDYLGKLRINTNAQARVYQALVFKIGQSDGVSDETYLGLTAEDFERSPLRRYAGSQKDNMDTEHRQLQLQHVISPAKFLDITTTLYRNDFKRNWYKLAKAGGVGIATILDDPATWQEEYQAIAGNGTDTLTVKANNREYYSKGLQSIVGLQFETRKVTHDIEVGLRLHKDEMDRFQWIDDYAIEEGVMSLIGAGIPGTESNRIESAKAFAGFIQYTLNYGSWVITPGLRYENITATKEDYGKNDVIRSGVNLKRKKNKVYILIPGVGIDYQFNRNFSFFGGVHKGFSPPGSTEGAEPEESVNYELGTRYKRKSLRFNGVVFINDYSNLLGSDLAAAGGGGTTEQFNGGETLVKGTEVQVAYNLFEIRSRELALPLAIAYTYTDAEFRNSFNSDFEAWGVVNRGDQLPYLAKHQLAIDLGLEHKGFDLNLSAKYVGKMRNIAGSGEIPGEQLIGPQFITDVSSNVLLNRNITLFGAVRNLTNEVYLVSRRPAGLRPGMPGNFLMGVKAVF